MDKDKIVIVVGPVIGKVTNDSARILIEIGSDSELTMSVSKEGAKKSIKKLTKSLNAGRPSIFVFNELEEGSKYIVKIESPHSYKTKGLKDTPCQFKTPKEKLGDEPLNIVVLSCNAIWKEFQFKEDQSLWTDILKRVENIDYIFHTGDQVYMDNNYWFGDRENVYARAMEVFEKGKPDQKMAETIKEMIRDEYRKTWGHPPVAKVLRSVANLMICDDHEFYDDFGFKDNYGDKKGFDFFFSEQARFCYYEYQRVLREDVDFEDFSKIKAEHFHYILSEIGIIFTEFRGSRTWLRKKGDDTFLGKKQWDDIKVLYGEGGKFEKVRSTLFFTPTPIVLLSQAMAKIVLPFFNDVQEQLTLKNSEELTKLIDLLRLWRERTSKELVLVGGDLHMAGYTNIYFKDELALKQVTTSAIAQAKVPKLAFMIGKMIIDTREVINDNYSFEHYNWTEKHNYAIIRISKIGSSASIVSRLVTYDECSPPKEEDEVKLNWENKSNNCSCACSIY